MNLVALVDKSASNGTELVEAWLNSLEGSLAGIGLPPPLKHGDRQTPVVFRLQHSRAQYLARIEAALREINAGESYEVCLTNKLVTQNGWVDGFSLYRTLQRIK